MTKRRLYLALFALLILGALPAVAQKDPTSELGFHPERLYHFTEVDSVNANNGNLVVALPVGLSYTLSPTLSYQFNLVYNSKVWDYETWEDDGVIYREARPSWRSDAGLGWIFSMGRLLPPTDPTTLPPPYKTGPPGTYEWIYEGPSGDEHNFGSDQVALRLVRESPTSTIYRVFSIDGVTRKFDCVFGRCYLQEISDSFGNWVRIDTSDLSQWIVTDSADRTHTIRFGYSSEMSDGVSRGFQLDSITEESYGGAPVTYQIVYTPMTMPGICGADRPAPGKPPVGTLPFLTSIVQPDGTTFDFDYYLSGSNCEQGSLKKMRFPTGGTTEYTYQPYTFASGDVCNQASGLATGTVGIGKRTITDGTRNPDGSLKQRVWDYVQMLGPQAPVIYPYPDPCHNGSPPQGPYYWSRTSILSPVDESGKRTRTDHYFDNWSSGQYTPVDPFVSEAERFGLIYDGSFAMPPAANARKITSAEVGAAADVSALDADHRGISTQTYGGCDSAGDCTNGLLLRTVYKNWQLVSRPMSRDDHNNVVYGLVRYPDSTRTVYNDDVDGNGNPSCGTLCYVDSKPADFDKVSNFREVTTSSNFPGASTVVSKTKYPTWTDDQVITVPNPWIANTYSERSTSENGQTATEQFCFNESNGFLERHRVLAGAAPAPHDILSVFTSSGGFPGTAIMYGGDKQDLGSDADLCHTALPTSFWYKVENTYDAGIVRTSRSFDRLTGLTMPFLSINRTIDHSSGAVKQVIDSAGVTTTYDYEALPARLQKMTLPGAASTSYTYHKPTGTAGDATFAPASVDAVTTSTTGQSSRNVVFDGVGRPLFDSHTDALRNWVASATTYDALGRVRSTSTPQPVAAPATLGFVGTHTATFAYDALGRTVEVQQPDGAKTITHYTGDRVVARSTKVAMAGGEQPSWTTETYDAQQRLTKVVEGQRSENATGVLTADYHYDVAGRLTSMESYGSGTPVQRRSFNYDGRGFLLSETHPEKGINGNGTTDYSDYDPKGHAGRKDERGTRVFSLKYTYDSAERLTRIESVDPAAYDPSKPLQWRLFKRFDFDTDSPATNSVNGKLVRATRHNYLTAFSAPRDVVVSEHYSYGTTGAVSERKTCTTSVTISPGVTVPEVCDDALGSNTVFSTKFSYDDLGDLTATQLPGCSGCALGTPAPSRFSVNTFTDGWLQAIGTKKLETDTPSTLARLQYAASGAVSAVEHLTTTGGVTLDTITPDPKALPRPSAITFDGWTSCALPLINSNPGDAAVPMGTTATLSVSVTSDETPAYQWFSSDGAIAGATGDHYETPEVYATTFYYAAVTNSCGTVRSQTAKVSLDCPELLIVSQPGDTTVVEGQTAQLAVGTSGNVTAYKWFEGVSGDASTPAPLPPGTTEYTAQYMTPAIARGETRRFWAQVLGTSCGTAASRNSATATVTATSCAPATITQQPPASVESSGGALVQLSIGVSGNQPRVEWHNAADNSLAGSGMLLSVRPIKTTTYVARVYWTPCPGDPNGPDHIDSIQSTVHITSCSLVSIGAQPSDQLVQEGHSATISMSATLKDVDQYLQAATITWYQGVSGDTAHPMQIVNAFAPQALSYVTPVLQDDAQFWARIAIGPKSVSPSCPTTSIEPKCTGCSVDTRTVTVVVCHPPVIQKQPQPAITTPGIPAKLSIDAKGTGLRFWWYYGPAGDTSNPVSTYPSYGGQAEIPITADRSVWVRIIGACGQADSVAVSVRLCYPPNITAQPPEALAILTGQTPKIAVDSDQADATYTWWEDNAGIGTPVGSGKEFTLPLLPGETTHTYIARASNWGCHTDSRQVTVTVCTPPAITSWLTEVYTGRGVNVDLRVVASSDATTYTWYRGITGDISHPEAGPGSSATLSRAPLETTQYWVRISNGRCTTDSPTATVYVCKPDIVTQPLAQNIAAGTSANLSVAAAGSQPFSYQWYEGDSGDLSHPLTGYTQQNITVTPTQDKSYWVAVTSPCPTPQPARSNAALIRVCAPPVITASPASKTVCLGTPTELTVTATGTDLHYQWWIGPSGTTTQPIGGSDSNKITVTPTQTTTYWVQVTSGCVLTNGSTPPANSVAATLTVNVPPTVTGPDDKTVVQGGAAQLSVSANQTSTFEWYQGVSGNTANHVGSGSAFTTPALSQTAQYWTRASNGQCTTDSRTATVTVCIPPTISSWTGDMTSPRGATVALNVAASGATSYTLYLGTAPDVSHPINGAGAGPTASFNVAPLQTTSYWVRASNGTCFRDSTTTTIYVCTPDITTQPTASQMIVAGAPTTLSVVAAGTTPLSYQWYQGTSGDTTHPIAGYTGSSAQVSPTVNTFYWVSVASPCPTPAPARSATAVVNVCNPASITAQPQSQIVRLGSSIDLTVTATATNATLHYQWWVGPSGTVTQPIGGDSPRLTVSPAQTTQYWVSVTATKNDGSSNSCGSAANSAAAMVTVCVPPTVTGPDDKIAVINGTATLTVSANQSCTYQWYQGVAPNTSVYVGSGASFQTPALTQPTQYWVRANNGQCTTDSRTATVSICTPPSITTQPSDQTTTSGQLVYLTVAASSDATTYTWYQGTAPDASTPIVGPGNYPTIGIAPQVTTSYWVRVSNGSCSTNSTTATVRVCGPLITQQPQNVTIISGSTTTLSVSANGTPPLSYQWYNGTAPNTASPVTTNGNQSYLNVNPTTNKSYWVRVSTSCGSVDSRTATVTVTACTTVAINSTSSYYDGTAWQLSASVTGTAVQAEWYKSDPPGSPYVRFATTASASLVPQSSTVYVYVHAYNPCSERIQYLTLTIPSGGMAPMIASDPSSATYSGKTATPMRVKAHGQNLSYQWYASDPDGSPYVPIAGEHSPELTILPQSPVASYYALVMNEAGLVQSAAATLRQVSCASPTITMQPLSNTDDGVGSQVLLNVDAAGDAPLSYQWYASDARGGGWKPVDGGTWNALAVDAGTPAYYFVRVRNACGTADSDYVSVSPSNGCAAPSIMSQPQGTAMDQQSGAALAVDAPGSGLDYQWFRSDTAMAQWLELSGATKPSARLAAPLSPAYSYVRVRKCGKTVNSSVAAVRTLTTGCTPPSIATVPSIVMAAPGTPVALTVDASGDSLTYQWFVSDPDSVSPPALIQDSSSNTFSYTPASARSLVFVRVTDNVCGTFTDMAGYWVVISAPPCGTVEITHQPDDATIAVGETAQLTVTASASCPLTYQWYVGEPSSGWTPLYGETSPTLRVSPMETEYYRVTVAAADGTVVASHTAAVRIK